MRKIFYLCLLVFFSITGVSGAAVLTFDDISRTDFWEYIPDGYGGFDWDKAGVISRYENSASGYYSGTVSGDYAAFNPYAKIITVSRPSLFDFTGIYVTSAFYSFQEILFTGYSDGTELYQATVTAGYSAPVWTDFSFYGVDTLIIQTVSDTDPRTYIDNYFALDNLTWEEHTAPVPEPSTLILLAAGLVTGIAGRRRAEK